MNMPEFKYRALLIKAELKARRKLEKKQYLEAAKLYMEQRNEERMEIYNLIYNESNK